MSIQNPEKLRFLLFPVFFAFDFITEFKRGPSSVITYLEVDSNNLWFACRHFLSIFSEYYKLLISIEIRIFEEKNHISSHQYFPKNKCELSCSIKNVCHFWQLRILKKMTLRLMHVIIFGSTNKSDTPRTEQIKKKTKVILTYHLICINISKRNSLSDWKETPLRVLNTLPRCFCLRRFL